MNSHVSMVMYLQDWIKWYVWKMADRLHIQWNGFAENVHSAFGKLRQEMEFTDVTLVCEDGEKIDSHKIILSAASPLFEKMLRSNKHPHPIIYLRGFLSKNLVPILDFLYFGESKVSPEDLDSFLKIGQDFQLEGLNGLNTSDLLNQQEIFTTEEPINETKRLFFKTSPKSSDPNSIDKAAFVAATKNPSNYNFKALNEKVKSMMKRSPKQITEGRKREICRVCGKEGLSHHIRDHIEAKHLEGLSIPCDYCEKTFGARVNLSQHISRVHRRDVVFVP